MGIGKYVKEDLENEVQNVEAYKMRNKCDSTFTDLSFIYIVACIPSYSLVDGKSDRQVWRIHFAILR